MVKNPILLAVVLMLAYGFFSEATSQQQRFPQPEFETGYVLPDTSTPEPRSASMEYVDLLVLILVLAFTIWLIFKKRSRRYILWTSVFALIYFGFYRNGCICSIGAVQNLALAIFSNSYTISITVLAFFIIPLLVSLFAGRIFCASACPLGAIQDLVVFKPVKVAPWLQKTLGLFPFIYLGLAILFAATGTDFIICRYDPFVGIFRMSAEFHMVMLGAGFLLVGAFVARPYCRFVCPYGALLSVTSRFSGHHLSITPAECIKCKLCKDSCPFDAIDKPTEDKEIRPNSRNSRNFILYALLLPVFVFVTAWAVSLSHSYLAKAHPDVYLANLLIAKPEMIQDSESLDVQTFLASGRTLDQLVEDASAVQLKFKRGSWFLGGFIGLVIAITLLNQVIFRRRTIYEANRSECLSCGRCMDYCPVGKPEHPWFAENPDKVNNS